MPPLVQLLIVGMAFLAQPFQAVWTIVQHINNRLGVNLPSNFGSPVASNAVLLLFASTRQSHHRDSVIGRNVSSQPAFPDGLCLVLGGSAIGIRGHNDFGVLVLQLVNSSFNALQSGFADTELLMQRNGGAQTHDLSDRLSGVVHFGLKRLFHGSTPPEIIQTRREPHPDQLRASAWVFTATSSLLPFTAPPVS